MSSKHPLQNWRESTRGRLICGVLELAIAYGLGSRAIDTGSWWQYGLTALLLIDGVQNLIKLIGNLFGAKHKTN